MNKLIIPSILAFKLTFRRLNLKLDDFDFHLPPHLIAQYPLAERRASRLLHVNIPQQLISHHDFADFLSWFNSGDVLVFNDTKVIPARLFGHKASGGKIECLVERILAEKEAIVHIRASKSPADGSQIFLANAFSAWIIKKDKDLYHIRIESEHPLLSLLEKYGVLPLPHYIDRLPEHIDRDRYQTIYARELGAVAAPTAGLHFDAAMLNALQQKGVKLAYITLHIGAGTFQPVRENNLDLHQMHSEFISINEDACATMSDCRSHGGRVIAVGTTVARCLETAAGQGVDEAQPYRGETCLFIRPGYRFKIIDGLLTNFHLPKTTLLMLVSAFGGYDLVMKAYKTAVEQNYRFFSYGDAMLLLKDRRDRLFSENN